MQLNTELSCVDCNMEFNSASSLLKHFALHVSQTLSRKQEDYKLNKRIPDLYPIADLKKLSSRNVAESDLDTSDLLNPLKYCLVTMNDEENVSAKHTAGVLSADSKKSKLSRKYECTYCPKKFGWSTDLKRHVLTHTGERPFECCVCGSKFTRNFLLQKHHLRQHNILTGNIGKVPALKPIAIKQKSKKNNIYVNYNIYNAKNIYQSVKAYEVKADLLCST